ncbi:3-dehydroquinate synthase [Zhouia amylolytica]|uniref:3-dehydroquinate synthase n=1 Tax=Zhouia amylolytica TaxID=376730 RepID=A0A1I6URF9_9FLAO|nr:3-dehydroquinate synthase [Zhouia amylolytica]MCQ0110761.1 3-dehydroquinate synthase [Zhouia amylolytica]SFT03990.1 3-dehydroquinate synthase [Zhouia amylolytica]
MLQPITCNNYTIHFNEEIYTRLNKHIDSHFYSKIFVLVDENTHEHCLPYFLSNVQTNLEIEIIEIEAGEEHKNIETCSGVWNVLSELGADRKSLMINLGGGVVTDLGGFVASTFMRGIDFINVPTTLLAMVDASVGGKTGVDLGSLKNQIGVINVPVFVFVDTKFLNTLPSEQVRSGFAEMLKHGLIHDEKYWDKLLKTSGETNELDNLIHESIVIKNKVVMEDPKESGLRKTLNYGHTLGHAIESYFLQEPSKPTLLHGEAIAIGMILATFLSHELHSFPVNKLKTITEVFIQKYGKVQFEPTDYERIIELLKFDKKNAFGDINFVLLEDIGKTIIDVKVDNDLIIKSFEYYKNH